MLPFSPISHRSDPAVPTTQLKRSIVGSGFVLGSSKFDGAFLVSSPRCIAQIIDN